MSDLQLRIFTKAAKLMLTNTEIITTATVEGQQRSYWKTSGLMLDKQRTVVLNVERRKPDFFCADLVKLRLEAGIVLVPYVEYNLSRGYAMRGVRRGLSRVSGAGVYARRL